MTKYTIVDEGYDVTLWNSIKEVFEHIEGLCLSKDDDQQITLSTLRKLLKEDYPVIRLYDNHELYTLCNEDWFYKVAKHKF